MLEVIKANERQKAVRFIPKTVRFKAKTVRFKYSLDRFTEFLTRGLVRFGDLREE